MTQSILYEIIETKYMPKEQAKKMALDKARKNIGVRYAVFREGSNVAEFQAYYRTTIKCPKCGEVIPLE
jgi:hypothetical protein